MSLKPKGTWWARGRDNPVEGNGQKQRTVSLSLENHSILLHCWDFAFSARIQSPSVIFHTPGQVFQSTKTHDLTSNFFTELQLSLGSDKKKPS